MADFQVSRADLRRCRVVPMPEPGQVTLPDGTILVGIDAFAFTANNVTYGVAGDLMSYWQFFPAEPGWGRIPVGGFGRVLRSGHADVAVGERLFGYFPMASHTVLQIAGAGPETLIEGSPHRRGLPVFYNQYVRTAQDPLYAPETEDRQMLLRPLFATAFLLDDFLAESSLFGARAVVLTSASSKTAMALAHLLSHNQRAAGGVIGLTSTRNRAFVEGLHCYDRVVTYDALASLPADLPVVTVDMAGDGELLARLHRHFGASLRYSCLVGITHWERMDRPADLPGPTPVLFFAPEQARKRAEALGPDALSRRLAAAWQRFLDASASWIRVVHGTGPEAVERVYRLVLEGKADPALGYVLSMR